MDNHKSLLENILEKINKVSASDTTQMMRLVVLNDEALETEETSKKPFEIRREILKGWKILINRDYQEGISTSIKKAVEKCSSADIDGILLFLGDMPLVPEAVIEQVINESRAHPRRFVRPYYRDVPGFPVFIPRRFFKELLTLTGDDGAKRIINEHSEDIEVIQTDERGCIFDIDQKQDLKKIQKSV